MKVFAMQYLTQIMDIMPDPTIIISTRSLDLFIVQYNPILSQSGDDFAKSFIIRCCCQNCPSYKITCSVSFLYNVATESINNSLTSRLEKHLLNTTGGAIFKERPDVGSG